MHSPSGGAASARAAVGASRPTNGSRLPPSRSSRKTTPAKPFDHAKIKRGLEKACWKRPISDQQLEAVIAAVESEIEANFESEVESRLVGELVMQQLRSLDEVAYVRFASVYRQFKDVQDFVKELQPMLAEAEDSE